VNAASILIVTDQPEFARRLTARWQAEREVPALTQVSSDIWNAASASGYDLVIVGPVRDARAAAILRSLAPHSVPALCVASDERESAGLQMDDRERIVLPQQNDWATTVVLVAGESLRRAAAQRRAETAELAVEELRRSAMLGRYMLEMRSGFNDALTSALGNADLLLLEPSWVAPEARESLFTLHRMTLRLNEMLQRFSSLASELQLIEKPSHVETGTPSDSLIGGHSESGALL
jgi:hypothetical protein